MNESAMLWLRARAASQPLPALDCDGAIAAWEVLRAAGDERPHAPFESCTKHCSATCRRGMASHVRRNK